MFKVNILTVSDRGSRGEREDTSGQVIREVVATLGAQIVDYAIVPDEKDHIAEKLIQWADGGTVDIILTTGGTGLSPRDVTPEATLSVVDRLAPGLPEMMRAISVKKTPHAILSRAVAGTRKKTLIVNLPGSPKAVRECLEAIASALPHAAEVLRGQAQDCAVPEVQSRGER